VARLRTRLREMAWANAEAT
jgi:hypothetical protein